MPGYGLLLRIEALPVITDLQQNVIVKSHQSWLAVELAKQNACVVALNHPGSTSGDSAATTNTLAWHRPEDIAFLLDSLLADPQLSPNIDTERIGMVGHSLGGYTALAIGGGEISLDRFIQYCADNPNSPDCIFYRAGRVDFAKVDRAQFEQNHRDERVAALGTIDPAYAGSVKPESLNNVADILLIGAPVIQGEAGDLRVNFLADLIFCNRSLQLIRDHSSGDFTIPQYCFFRVNEK